MCPTDRWTSGADYDQWMGRWSRLLAHEFLKWLKLPKGLRWIDVCCGSGVVTEAIAQECGPVAVVGVDLSGEQIEFARHRRSSSNVNFQVANAEALPFVDASFDVAVCCLGLNYIPHPARGLDEMSRVVCPGGIVAAYLWDYARGARFLREFWDAAAVVDPTARDFDQANRFPMCTEDGLRDMFAQAGLAGLSTHALNIVTKLGSFDDYWQPLLTAQGSAPNYLAARDPEVQTAIRERLKEALKPDSQGAIVMPARAWAIRAQRL